MEKILVSKIHWYVSLLGSEALSTTNVALTTK